MYFEEGLYKNKYRIKSARYVGYDYSQSGYYFVTICTAGREMYFGEVISENYSDYSGDVSDASVALSEMGKVAKKFWLEIPQHFPNVILDEYIIMPNHVHGIIIIQNVETQDFASGVVIPYVETHNYASLRNVDYKNKFGPQSNNLSSIIRGFKGAVTDFIRYKYN